MLITIINNNSDTALGSVSPQWEQPSTESCVCLTPSFLLLSQSLIGSLHTLYYCYNVMCLLPLSRSFLASPPTTKYCSSLLPLHWPNNYSPLSILTFPHITPPLHLPTLSSLLFSLSFDSRLPFDPFPLFSLSSLSSLSSFLSSRLSTPPSPVATPQTASPRVILSP